MPPYLFTYALAAAHRGDLVGARDAMLRSAQIDGLPVAWLNVAKLELDLGNAAASQAALGEAMRLGYQSPRSPWARQPSSSNSGSPKGGQRLGGCARRRLRTGK